MEMEKKNGVYFLRSKQVLPISLEEAWDFFSQPKNLAKITPPDLGLKIEDNNTMEVYAGCCISYKVKIAPMVYHNWLTEITHVRAPHFFVDEQRMGPYKIWHHEHHFRKHPNGVEMTDIITYLPPFGFLGHLLHPLLVKPQLKKIFAYRESRLEELFLSNTTHFETRSTPASNNTVTA